ncbi:LysR family transcriptional regulator [Variovorax sp. CAN2819]|uniref:LysR family transcriptional regulator n=1 Tax=Variovorax sp. CAN15 TaxID=3046727 RepID=UPI002648D5FD|nr:LysR family transcriptional regulator [Variovorax sp. CAN15]MDN6884679.1 LysR family transcriptional regulator [Variovorax sp. CAN15]
MSFAIRDLELFLSVAELGQLSKVAKANGGGDATVASAIRRLETEVGMQLLERGGQGVFLTPFGQEFLRRAHQICASHRDLVRHLDDVRAGEAGVFRVGGTIATLRLLIEPALARLHVKLPGVRTELATASTESLLEQLLQGQIDVAVLPAMEKTPPRFRQTRIWSGHLVPVVRSGHPLTRLNPPQIEDLAAYSWILPTGNPVLREEFRLVFAGAGMDFPHVSIESTMGMLTDRPSPLSLQTDLITYMAKPVADVFTGSVEVLPLERLWQPMGASAMSRVDGYWSPALDEFVGSLVAVGESGVVRP